MGQEAVSTRRARRWRWWGWWRAIDGNGAPGHELSKVPAASQPFRRDGSHSNNCGIAHAARELAAAVDGCGVAQHAV